MDLFFVNKRLRGLLDLVVTVLMVEVSDRLVGCLRKLLKSTLEICEAPARLLLSTANCRVLDDELLSW